MIINPTPITAGVFNGMWITQLRIVVPTEGTSVLNKGIIQCSMLPYDGTYLLNSGGKTIRILDLQAKKATDIQLATMINNLVSEIKRISSRTEEPKFIDVFAQNPERPVAANILFAAGKPYCINDCFGLAKTDQFFAAVFQATMVEVARQIGLSYQ